MQKSGLYETLPRRQFKDYFCYFTIWLIYQLVHDIPSDRGIANLVPSVLSLVLRKNSGCDWSHGKMCQ